MLDGPALAAVPAAPFRPHSRHFLAARPAAARKPFGQYLTPRAIRARLLDLVPLAPRDRVLDPGAGTGEFLEDVVERCPSARVEGWEIDPELVALARQDAPRANVIPRDALATPPRETFDLVIGNPPYYEFKADAAVRGRFASVISGRPNVFATFFQVGLDALKAGGTLAYVVPPSMNNGAYFAALRRHIVARAAVERIEILRDPLLFDGAQQSVMLIVLRKGARSNRHVLDVDLGAGPEPLFLEDPQRLSELLDGHATLADLGFTIRTGRVVWNQRKSDLRRSRVRGAVPLIWSHNVGDGRLEWAPDHPKRPQYVLHSDPDRGPAIVVNRVVGAVGSGRLRAALVPKGFAFVGENHVNVIRGPDGASESFHRRVLRGLLSERTAETMRELTGNTQLSATELARLIPVLPNRFRPIPLPRRHRAF